MCDLEISRLPDKLSRLAVINFPTTKGCLLRTIIIAPYSIVKVYNYLQHKKIIFAKFPRQV